jgi:hypothetical protein
MTPATDVYHDAMRHYATLEVAAPPRLEAWLDDVIRIERAQAIIRRGLRRLAFRDTAHEVDAILAELRAVAGSKYATDGTHNERTIAAFRKAGATDTLVSIGGFGLITTHLGNTLVSIQPKGKSYLPKYGGRLGLTLWAMEQAPSKGAIQLGRYRYSLARWDQPTRLTDALKLAAEAFLRAGGDLDLFLEAVGETGQCAICGRFLTDPLSRARGIGPECIKTIYAGFFEADLDTERAAAVARARAQRART